MIALDESIPNGYGVRSLSKVLKAKSVSYGLVELIDTQSSWGLRYSIHVNGKVKETSNDLTSLVQTFDKKYH